MTAIKCGLCGKIINVYGECDCKEEENVMNEVKLTPFEQIKEEFCSRYALNPEDINITLDIKANKSLGQQILSDFEGYEHNKGTDYFPNDVHKCANVYPKSFHSLWVHLK
jgi:hypothetical protein